MRYRESKPQTNFGNISNRIRVPITNILVDEIRYDKADQFFHYETKRRCHYYEKGEIMNTV